MKQAKSPSRKARIVSITYEPDYSHEAWERDGEMPTLSGDPDAFYARSKLAYPVPVKPSTRRTPRETLSRRALGKRLYQAGVRHPDINRIATEILARPIGVTGPMGKMALGWNVETLKARYGKRIACAILKFVRVKFLVLDEAWHLLGDANYTSWLTTISRSFRKSNTTQILVSQTEI